MEVLITGSWHHFRSRDGEVTARVTFRHRDLAAALKASVLQFRIPENHLLPVAVLEVKTELSKFQLSEVLRDRETFRWAPGFFGGLSHHSLGLKDFPVRRLTWSELDHCEGPLGSWDALAGAVFRGALWRGKLTPRFQVRDWREAGYLVEPLMEAERPHITSPFGPIIATEVKRLSPRQLSSEKGLFRNWGYVHKAVRNGELWVSAPTTDLQLVARRI